MKKYTKKKKHLGKEKKIKMKTFVYFSTHFSGPEAMHTGHSVLLISAW